MASLGKASTGRPRGLRVLQTSAVVTLAIPSYSSLSVTVSPVAFAASLLPCAVLVAALSLRYERLLTHVAAAHFPGTRSRQPVRRTPHWRARTWRGDGAFRVLKGSCPMRRTGRLRPLPGVGCIIRAARLWGAHRSCVRRQGGGRTGYAGGRLHPQWLESSDRAESITAGSEYHYQGHGTTRQSCGVGRNAA